MIARKHPGDQLQDIAPSTTFYMKIPYKWYLFRKLEYSAIGFKNEIGDYIIKRPLVLDINRLDLYGGPCTLNDLFDIYVLLRTENEVINWNFIWVMKL